MVRLTVSLPMVLLRLMALPTTMVLQLPHLTPHPSTILMVHHPLPHLLTLPNLLIPSNPQLPLLTPMVGRLPLLTPRVGRLPLLTPRVGRLPLRHHLQPTPSQILIPSNLSNTISSHSMTTTASNFPMEPTNLLGTKHNPSLAMEHHQLTTQLRPHTTLLRPHTILLRLQLTSTQHSHSTSSNLAMEDTKEGTATLPRHLTSHSQRMVSQPRTEHYLQPTLSSNHPTLSSNRLTLSNRPTQHSLSLLRLSRRITPTMLLKSSLSLYS